MKLFAWLKRKMAPVPLTCPRCLGKGQVDKDDIIRLKQEGKWDIGICAYCNGTGHVPEDMLSKVPVDATWLTNDLAEPERNALIHKHSQETQTIDTEYDDCPVSEQNRLWLEDAFLLLLDFFGREKMLQRKMLIPHYSDFPIQYDGTEQSAFESMKIVAAQMEVPCDRIELKFYEDGVREIQSGGVGGGHIFLEGDKENPAAAGLYWGQGENAKHEIWLNYNTLSQPETMVATLAHEIAHIKLLGENRLEYNDEHLTDLTTVIFGLGIFNANAAFQTFKDSSSYGWQSHGYLSQMQWAYALALYAYVRDEKSPAWTSHLTPNVKGGFLRGMRFITDNPELVFVT